MRLLRQEDIRVEGATQLGFAGSPGRPAEPAYGAVRRAGMSPEDAERDFSALVREYRKPVYCFVLRHVGRPADAEDIAQQTFVEAYSALASFRGQSSISTWLYGIAMNIVRNYLNRAPHRVRQYEPDDVLTTLPADEDGPDTLVQRMELLTTLYGEVAALTEDLRQVFMLVAIEGRSYEEAAQMLGIPIGTVRSRLFRAREVIKERLPELRDALQS